MVCKNCGSFNDDNAKFCIGCGAILAEQQDVTAQEAETGELAPPPADLFIPEQARMQSAYDGNKPDADAVAPSYENTPPANTYTPPVYQNPPVAPTNVPAPGKGLGVASMVCGIVSFFCFGVILGILAIIFGGVAKSKGYRGGMATAGIVCGAVGLGLYVLLFIIGAGTSMLIPFVQLPIL